MSDLLWDDVREWFEPDGSLLDVYVFDTTVADWQAFVDLVRSKGWWFAYSEDSRSRRLPDHVADVLARRGELTTLLQVRPVPEILANVHFFTDEEIEADFAPEELQGQERLDLLCNFLRAVGRRLGNHMIEIPVEPGRHTPQVRDGRDSTPPRKRSSPSSAPERGSCRSFSHPLPCPGWH